MRSSVQIATEADGAVVIVMVTQELASVRPEDTTPGWSDMPDDPSWWDLPEQGSTEDDR